MLNAHQQAYKENKEQEQPAKKKRPDWLRVRLGSGQNYSDVKLLVKEFRLNTVCEEARCPNMGECWESRTATFMILGDTCTRSCGFCNVKTGVPAQVDLDEPHRVAEAVKTLKLRHAVITSVNRDELADGGAAVFSDTVRRIRETAPECTVEILIPDFKGYEPAFQEIMKFPPDILNHNIETVPRLYHVVRPQAIFDRTLNLIKWFNAHGLKTKSGIMVGIGETKQEVIEVLQQLREHGCNIVTIGQYLQPSPKHLPIDRFVELDEFAFYRDFGLSIGFTNVESSPLVRSSYHADKHAR